MRKFLGYKLFGGILTCCGLLAFVGSCGPKSSSASSGLTKTTVIQIPDSLQNVATANSSSSLALTNTSPPTITAYNYLLTGCASGRTLTCSTADIGVYWGDQSCIVKLTSFTTSTGQTYNAGTGCSSISWQAGSQCAFVNVANTSSSVVITTLQQLSSPTVTTDKATFEWAEIESGTAQLFQATTLGFNAPTSVGVQPDPQYQVSQLTYYGINTNGTGNFGFNLQCIQQMTKDTTNSTTTALGLTLCENYSTSTVTYALVADPGGTYSSTQLETLMTGSTIYTIAAPGDLIATGLGGWKTKVMTGPGQISTSSHMLLILRETMTVGTATVKSYRTISIELQSLPGCTAESTGGSCN